MSTAKVPHHYHSKRFQILLASLITLCVIWTVAAVGSWLTTPQIPHWYANLVKPPLTPPNSVFGPVWTVLYLLMAAAAVLVWREGWKKIYVERALYAFSLQLFLNLLWSALFFGLHNPLLALLNIFLLWDAIVLTIALFWRVSRLAAILLIPYLLWVSFATYLNAGIVFLN